MNEKAVNRVVSKAVPGVMSQVAPLLIPFAEQVARTVETVGCRNQIVLAKAIEQLGPQFVESSFELAEKLVECANITAESNVRESNMIVEAVMNDQAVTIQEKVELVKKWNDAKTSSFVKKVKAASIGVASAAGVVGLSVAAPKVGDSIIKASAQRAKAKASAEKSVARSKAIEKFSLASTIEAIGKAKNGNQK